MSDRHPWAVVSVGVVGGLATLLAGLIGYQSGVAVVNKDYVELAITTLQKEDASPELRRWSVDVLAKFSPVPFGQKLKEELRSDGIYTSRFIYQRTKIPDVISEFCPDLSTDDLDVVEAMDKIELLEKYEMCRLKHESVVSLVQKLDALAEEAQRNSDK